MHGMHEYVTWNLIFHKGHKSHSKLQHLSIIKHTVLENALAYSKMLMECNAMQCMAILLLTNKAQSLKNFKINTKKPPKIPKNLKT